MGNDLCKYELICADWKDGLLLPCKMHHIHDYHHYCSSAGAQAIVSSLYKTVSAKLPAASRLLIEKGKSIYSVVSCMSFLKLYSKVCVTCCMKYKKCCSLTHFACLFVDLPTYTWLTDCVGILWMHWSHQTQSIPFVHVHILFNSYWIYHYLHGSRIMFAHA